MKCSIVDRAITMNTDLELELENELKIIEKWSKPETKTRMVRKIFDLTQKQRCKYQIVIIL